jgi:hypothetical protein
MAEKKRRMIDRIIDPAFLEGVEEVSLEQLRQMRDECHEVEKELSFERRLSHARVDILSAELERRSGGGSADLIARLPEILASEERRVPETPLPARAPDFSVPRNADIPRRRIEEIVGEQTLARLGQISADEIRAIIASLNEHESGVSTRRRQVHEVMNAIQEEIVRRYRTGRADPSAVLS